MRLLKKRSAISTELHYTHGLKVKPFGKIMPQILKAVDKIQSTLKAKAFQSKRMNTHCINYNAEGETTKQSAERAFWGQTHL